MVNLWYSWVREGGCERKVVREDVKMRVLNFFVGIFVYDANIKDCCFY